MLREGVSAGIFLFSARAEQLVPLVHEPLQETPHRPLHGQGQTRPRSHGLCHRLCYAKCREQATLMQHLQQAENIGKQHKRSEGTTEQ